MSARRRNLRFGALFVALGLILAACGSRGSDNADSTSSTTASSTSASSGETASPCGKGDAKGATDKGVTDTEIHIGTIADIRVEGVGNLFQGNLDATKAFVAYCNSLGGVNGRQLVLDFIDSKLVAFPNAMRQACDGDYLALVGSAAALDGGDGPGIGEACGIVDVPGFTADVAHRNATNMVTPLPAPPNFVQLGAALMMKEKYPDAVKKAAYVYSNRAVTMNTAVQRTEAMEKNGWTFSAPSVTSDLPSVQDYQAIVTKLQASGTEWVSFVGAPVALSNFLKAMGVVGWHPTVMDSDQSAYDPEVVAAAGKDANGLNFPSSYYPLNEAKNNPETQLYLDWLKKTNAVTDATALGIQSFSAGLLFASVVKDLGSDVTRENLLAGLKKVHSWTGEGLHAETNPGGNKTTECVMWMSVKSGRFVRVQPTGSDVYTCNPDFVIPVKAGTAQ